MTWNFVRFQEILNPVFAGNFSFLSQKLVNPLLNLSSYFLFGIPFLKLLLSYSKLTFEHKPWRLEPKTNNKQQKNKTNNKHLYFITFILGMLSFWIVLYIGIIGGSIYGNILVLWIVRTTRSLQNVNNLLVANLAVTGQLFSKGYWTLKLQSYWHKIHTVVLSDWIL